MSSDVFMFMLFSIFGLIGGIFMFLYFRLPSVSRRSHKILLYTGMVFIIIAFGIWLSFIIFILLFALA